ncbi:low-specificity L-threonine aldolase 1-like [Elaeis guineensis]|uniref:low-specificity L-threonine aldolase 1-like n=1 Tax=Elaeis guineensis var. tenera TaxID=51953 RepID=UPI003C6D4D21
MQGAETMVMRRVDLRSDTVTKPTEAMRAAMASADVEDDVLGSDPTAHRFESEMARVMGKEAALFVPSGTMGNLISVLVHCEVRGSEVILGDNSHIHVYENGGISTIGGVHPRTTEIRGSTLKIEYFLRSRLVVAICIRTQVLKDVVPSDTPRDQAPRGQAGF